MARYFFNVHDGFERPDHEGTELAGMIEARRAALQICTELLKRDESTFWDNPNWQVEVTDEQHLILFTISIRAWDAADEGRG